MKRITCVYTGFGGLSDIVEKIFLDACGDVCFHHIADSGLIEDILSGGGVTPLLENACLRCLMQLRPRSRISLSRPAHP